MPPADDHSIFTAIVLAHQERIRNLCHRFVADRDDADDITQDVFVQVYDALPRFRGDSELSTWIHRIAINRCLDHIRRRRRMQRFGWMIPGATPKDERAPEPVTPSDPHRDLEMEERRRLLHWAIDSLPENQRTTIILSRFEQMSSREIADIMGLSLSAVEALIHRAKQSLHDRLFRYFSEQDRRPRKFSRASSSNSQRHDDEHE